MGEAKETTFSEDLLGVNLSASSDPVEAAETALKDQGEAVLLDFEAKYEAPALPGREADELVPQDQPGETAEADLVGFETTKLEEDVGRPDSEEPVESAERPRSRHSSANSSSSSSEEADPEDQRKSSSSESEAADEKGVDLVGLVTGATEAGGDKRLSGSEDEADEKAEHHKVSEDVKEDDDDEGGGSNSPVTVGNESKFVTMTENEAEEEGVEKECVKDAQHLQQEPEETFRSSAPPSTAALPDQFLLQESQVITSTTEQVTSLSGGFQMTTADIDQFLSNTTTTTHMEEHQVTTKESQEEMNILSKTISSLENLSGEESPTKE